MRHGWRISCDLLSAVRDARVAPTRADLDGSSLIHACHLDAPVARLLLWHPSVREPTEGYRREQTRRTAIDEKLKQKDKVAKALLDQRTARQVQHTIERSKSSQEKYLRRIAELF
jgi:hypothetical protein